MPCVTSDEWEVSLYRGFVPANDGTVLTPAVPATIAEEAREVCAALGWMLTDGDVDTDSVRTDGDWMCRLPYADIRAAFDNCEYLEKEVSGFVGILDCGDVDIDDCSDAEFEVDQS